MYQSYIMLETAWIWYSAYALKFFRVIRRVMVSLHFISINHCMQVHSYLQFEVTELPLISFLNRQTHLPLNPRLLVRLYANLLSLMQFVIVPFKCWMNCWKGRPFIYIIYTYAHSSGRDIHQQVKFNPSIHRQLNGGVFQSAHFILR